ncbi:Protein of unknown function [Micromonospora purpureochromogenes]|uniref:DUF998 domain-containing protein n=1 Tax=Micromonospora purpureochromogenes TaxID=47872 RepID=A0A1C5A194_9ACTN|nr:DUF998 domain-containing protein [Micromonospora purpureochromogenes]SCF38906.1 Protein of unknown function [Micromonospora purpureochromogenes]
MAETTTARVAAASAAGCMLAGTVAVTVAVVAGPGSGLTGYVSEAGIAGSRYAPTYRIGVFALAAALLLLATALPPALRAAAALLGAGSVLTALSGAVTCSAGCPLPPFEAATVADLVHGGASIAAVAAVVFAMLALLLSPAAHPPLRRIAGVGVALALPLAAAIALAMLIVGRGGLVGGLERLLLAVTAAWALATATALGLAQR